MEKLKIALFLDTFYPMVDGVVNVVDNYAKLLSEKYDVTVIASGIPKGSDYKDNFNYRLVRCKIFPPKFGDYNLCLPKLDRKLKKFLKNEKFDIVHVHSPFTLGTVGIKYARKRHIPVVETFHSQYYQDFYLATKSKFISKRLLAYVAKRFNWCDELWTMNSKLVELAREYGYKGKVTIVPNGSDLKRDNFTRDEAWVQNFRKQYVTQGQKLLLYVGRIHVLKNLEFTVDVCEELKKRNFPFKMVWVGEGQDFEYFAKLIKKKNLEDTIVLIGKITDRKILQDFYAASDLFVFPSTYDTDGIVKSEAAAFKTPTIFLEGTIASSCAQDNFNGYIGANNPVQFADKIQQIFADDETYRYVCDNAEKTLFLTWEDVVKKVEANYLRMIEEYRESTFSQP